MKTKEELLKIFSAYLPYELKGKRTDGAKGDYILRAVYDDCSMIWKYDGFGNSKQIGFLPVLYPMDMLTKEIEHKGERFIPAEKLGWVDEYLRAMMDYLCFDMLVVSDYNDLLEWHFNVFGLDESEYIAKQSVIQK